MKVNGGLFSTLSTPLYDDFNDGAGGGAGGADIGGGAADSPSEPAVVDIPGDDALVKYPGTDKPVPFKNLRNFQAQWTRESQRRAEVERKLAERDAQLQRYEQERQAAARQGAAKQGGQSDVYEALRQLPYLDGEAAVQVVQKIQQDFAARDNILLQMAQRMQAMQRTLGQVNETYTNQGFDSKISRWLSEGNYPQEYSDLAKEIYLAYEGDDLDYEFPRIFAERVEQIEKAFEARRNAKVQAQRQNRFVPGKGGVAGPSKPLTFKGGESAKEIADALFPTFGVEGT
jgi:hypothetical protein